MTRGANCVSVCLLVCLPVCLTSSSGVSRVPSLATSTNTSGGHLAREGYPAPHARQPGPPPSRHPRSILHACAPKAPRAKGATRWGSAVRAASRERGMLVPRCTLPTVGRRTLAICICTLAIGICTLAGAAAAVPDLPPLLQHQSCLLHPSPSVTILLIPK